MTADPLRLAALGAAVVGVVVVALLAVGDKPPASTRGSAPTAAVDGSTDPDARDDRDGHDPDARDDPGDGDGDEPTSGDHGEHPRRDAARSQRVDAGSPSPRATPDPDEAPASVTGSAADPGLIALAEAVAGQWAAAFAADHDPDAWLERLAAHSTPALTERLATREAYRAGQALAPARVDGVAVGEAVAGRVAVTVTVTAADDDDAHRLSLVVVGDADAAAVAEVRL